MDRLYINNIEIELKKRSVALNFQINDLGELKNRQANFSNGIKIAKTPKNVIAMKMLGITGSSTRLQYEKMSIKYISGGIELISDGIGIIKNTDNYYNLIIYDGNIILSNDLGTSTLSDLDFSAYNHKLTQTLYQDSRTNTSGYLYAVGRFYENALTNIVDINLQSPTFYVHTLFEMIFAQIGAIISGPIFTDSDFLNKLVSTNNGYDRTITEIITNVLTRDNSGDTAINEGFASETTKSYLIDSYTAVNSINHKINLNGNIDFSAGINPYFQIQVNGVVVSNIVLNGSTAFNETIDTFANVGENINIYVVVTSENVGTDLINFQTNYITTIDENDSQIDIDFSLLFGETKQIDFVKAVMQHYALIYNKKRNSAEYEFIQMKNLLINLSDAEDWSDKFPEFLDEKYESNYAQINRLKYKYDDNNSETEQTFADGLLTVDNINLKSEKTLFTSLFKASEVFFNTNYYKLFHWEFKDEVIQAKNDGLRLFKKTIVNGSYNYRFSPEVSGTTSFTGAIPFLDFSGLTYQDDVNNNYLELQEMLQNYKIHFVKLKLSIIDIYNLNFFKLKYFKQKQRFFYLNKVINYQNNIKTKIELIEVKRPFRVVFGSPSNLEGSWIGNSKYDATMTKDEGFDILMGGSWIGDSQYDGVLTRLGETKMIGSWTGNSQYDATMTKLSDVLIVGSWIGNSQYDATMTKDSLNFKLLTGSYLGQSQYSGKLIADSTIIVTSFLTNFMSVDITVVCIQTEDTTYFHDGSAAFPQVGDTIYVDPDATTKLNGDNFWFLINTVDAMQVDTVGVVVAVNQNECVV